jgi:sporulation protein YlmC with PRC-barrel domain
MEIEYGATVVDKSGKALGKVDYIVLDSWSGEPRKYMVRREKEGDAVFFTPGQVAEVVKGKVKLSVTNEELEQI